ncbi:hypothetical protein PVT71_28650 (plasmid) [Salipiger sp. H15]|uniref:Tyr recombinase domain-containing protein n=1 Tax=Alloyangia sp. H15 TaxID=3029062 RepID=A0AAU8ASJ2_9RHOB
MNLFSAVTQSMRVAATPVSLDMQTVLDQTPNETERNRIARLEEFFAEPLSTLNGNGDGLLAWFDTHFPPLKTIGAAPLPGAERDFWRTDDAYAKWREVVRRRIRVTLGLVAARKALRTRIDGWTPLLGLLTPLSKDKGPVHPATFGAILALSDRARKAGIDPLDLLPAVVPEFLETMPAHEQDASAQALKALQRLTVVPEIAAHLPPGYDTDYLVPAARTPVPDAVRRMIAEMVAHARYNESTYDDVSERCKENFNDKTARAYEEALVALARAAQETDTLELASLKCLDPLFDCPVRIPAIRHWIALGKDKHKRFSLRTARDYVRIIAQIGKANGINTEPWNNARINNSDLQEGKLAGETMSPKNQKFCERLIHNPADVRTFLRQHVLYQERAQDILATDKPLTLTQLRTVRRFGTCAAFAALEIRGAGLRKGSALAAECEGPTQNLFRKTSGAQKLFELRVAQKDMKGAYVELPPVPVRDDKHCGYEVLDWFLTTARPLFDYANPEFCERNKCARATHLFVSEQSAKPLGGAMLYKWFTRSSAEIGLPMFPHNFRHGFATLLLARSWSNRGRAAAYLGCSVRVLETYYAFIRKRQKIEEVQDLLAEAYAGK